VKPCCWLKSRQTRIAFSLVHLVVTSSQWVTEVERTWSGYFLLCFDSDVGYCYVKQSWRLSAPTEVIHQAGAIVWPLGVVASFPRQDDDLWPDRLRACCSFAVYGASLGMALLDRITI
jgi:hypothetical protein